MDQQIVDIVATKDKKAPRKKMSQLFVGGSKKTVKRKEKPKDTHRMADGSVMTGKVHTKDSTKVRGAPKGKKKRTTAY
tara:strand:+ start:8354 stop:8587 length:234 start_codon:yes stop_codon:yes gene_type:complete